MSSLAIQSLQIRSEQPECCTDTAHWVLGRAGPAQCVAAHGPGVWWHASEHPCSSYAQLCSEFRRRKKPQGSFPPTPPSWFTGENDGRMARWLPNSSLSRGDDRNEVRSLFPWKHRNWPGWDQLDYKLPGVQLLRGGGSPDLIRTFETLLWGNCSQVLGWTGLCTWRIYLPL